MPFITPDKFKGAPKIKSTGNNSLIFITKDDLIKFAPDNISDPPQDEACTLLYLHFYLQLYDVKFTKNIKQHIVDIDVPSETTIYHFSLFPKTINTMTKNIYIPDQAKKCSKLYTKPAVIIKLIKDGYPLDFILMQTGPAFLPDHFLNLEKLSQAYIQMYEFYGFLHNDLHVGNIFWDNTKQTFVMIDFARSYHYIHDIDPHLKQRMDVIFATFALQEKPIELDDHPKFVEPRESKFISKSEKQMFDFIYMQKGKCKHYLHKYMLYQMVYLDIGGIVFKIMHEKFKDISKKIITVTKVEDRIVNISISNCILPIFFDKKYSRAELTKRIEGLWRGVLGNVCREGFATFIEYMFFLVMKSNGCQKLIHCKKNITRANLDQSKFNFALFYDLNLGLIKYDLAMISMMINFYDNNDIERDRDQQKGGVALLKRKCTQPEKPQTPQITIDPYEHYQKCKDDAKKFHKRGDCALKKFKRDHGIRELCIKSLPSPFLIKK